MFFDFECAFLIFSAPDVSTLGVFFCFFLPIFYFFKIFFSLESIINIGVYKKSFIILKNILKNILQNENNVRDL